MYDHISKMKKVLHFPIEEPKILYEDEQYYGVYKPLLWQWDKGPYQLKKWLTGTKLRPISDMSERTCGVLLVARNSASDPQILSTVVIKLIHGSIEKHAVDYYPNRVEFNKPKQQVGGRTLVKSKTRFGKSHEFRSKQGKYFITDQPMNTKTCHIDCKPFSVPFVYTSEIVFMSKNKKTIVSSPIPPMLKEALKLLS